MAENDSTDRKTFICGPSVTESIQTKTMFQMTNVSGFQHDSLFSNFIHLEVQEILNSFMIRILFFLIMFLLVFEMKCIPCGAERESFVRLFMPERMQIPAGTVLHYNAREVRGFEFGVESRQKRMIQHFQNFSLCFSSLKLLFQS